MIPFGSFLPLTDLNFNENFTSIIQNSTAILFWPRECPVLFNFDLNTNKIRLYNYQTELIIGDIVIDFNQKHFSCLSAILFQTTPNIQQEKSILLDMASLSGYYFLLQDYFVYSYSLVKNKRIFKLNLKDLEVLIIFHFFKFLRCTQSKM